MHDARLGLSEDVSVHLYDCARPLDHPGDCRPLLSGFWAWRCPEDGEVIGDIDPAQLERRIESHEYRAHKIVPAEFVVRA